MRQETDLDGWVAIATAEMKNKTKEQAIRAVLRGSDMKRGEIKEKLAAQHPRTHKNVLINLLAQAQHQREMLELVPPQCPPDSWEHVQFVALKELSDMDYIEAVCKIAKETNVKVAHVKHECDQIPPADRWRQMSNTLAGHRYKKMSIAKELDGKK